MVSPASMLKVSFLSDVFFDALEILAENDASGNPIYIGRAAPGVLASAAAWQIKKVTYDGNSSMTEARWANANPGFIHVWNDRAAQDYVP